jgi:hypothetical protein
MNSPPRTIPPRVSPRTPAKKTPDENNAELCRSRWYWFLKNDGIQVRNSHNVQP